MAADPAPDLAELRTFCTAADLGTLGRAAVRLRVSQPSLTKRLKSLEATVGVTLLERSPHGVKLTPAGRRLYEHARGLLESADAVAEIMVGLRRDGATPVRLAASHSATEAFVADLLARLNEARVLPVELVTANSQVVRDMVADGRADVGVAASRPHGTPNPAVRTEPLADDAIVCAVPPEHRWAGRRVALEEFLRTPMVVRDPGSNARWTVEAALRERGLSAAAPLVEAATPAAALREARRRCAPVLLSRHIVGGVGLETVEVDDLAFPRCYELVLPGHGGPNGDVRDLIDRLRDHIRIWVR
ncbi:MAG TPA: LysR family transcriptional regulator [Solirubrobacteraceae bacterium]|jgi:DNA-binding transcriptional LysR family regulator